MPISFTDSQLADLKVIATPLWPAARAAFLRALSTELGDRSTVEDGELHRIAVRLQHELLPRPALAIDGSR